MVAQKRFYLQNILDSMQDLFDQCSIIIWVKELLVRWIDLQIIEITMNTSLTSSDLSRSDTFILTTSCYDCI